MLNLRGIYTARWPADGDDTQGSVSEMHYSSIVGNLGAPLDVGRSWPRAWSRSCRDVEAAAEGEVSVLGDDGLEDRHDTELVVAMDPLSADLLGDGTAQLAVRARQLVRSAEI